MRRPWVRRCLVWEDTHGVFVLLVIILQLESVFNVLLRRSFAAMPMCPSCTGGLSLGGTQAGSCGTGSIPPVLLLAREAMFGLLDRRGHPIGCGLFVSSRGVAITVHHDINSWSKQRGGERIVEACRLDSSGAEIALCFRVVHGNSLLGFSVLQLLSSTRIPMLPTPYYALPVGPFPDGALWGKPASVVHGNLAYNRLFYEHPDASVSYCNISTVHRERLIYIAQTACGDSGGALLLSGSDLIGLHVEGLNDVAESPGGSRHWKTPSEASSPSVAACALRMDIEPVRAAVAAAVEAAAV